MPSAGPGSTLNSAPTSASPRGAGDGKDGCPPSLSFVRRKMIPLADIIARELAEPEGRDLQERLVQAMFMMERYRGIDAGWRDTVTQVADADISEQAITRLAVSLRVFIRTQKNHPDVGTAVWVLGKLRAPDDREIYEVVLAEGNGYSKFARDQSTVALEAFKYE